MISSGLRSSSTGNCAISAWISRTRARRVSASGWAAPARESTSIISASCSPGGRPRARPVSVPSAATRMRVLIVVIVVFIRIAENLIFTGLIRPKLANSRPKYARVRFDHIRQPTVELRPSSLLPEVGRARAGVDLAFLILRKFTPLERYANSTFDRVLVVEQEMEILFCVLASYNEVYTDPAIADKSIGVKAETRTPNAKRSPMLRPRRCRPNLAFAA